jgi:septal ring factor EnvC (AmiA/AmiB activator)
LLISPSSILQVTNRQLQHDKESLEKVNEWLQKELSIKSDELSETRRLKGEQIAALQATNESLEAENTRVTALLEQVRVEYRKTSQQLAEALEGRRAAEEERSILNEMSTQEIAARTKLADLYKVHLPLFPHHLFYALLPFFFLTGTQPKRWDLKMLRHT